MSVVLCTTIAMGTARRSVQWSSCGVTHPGVIYSGDDDGSTSQTC